MQEKSTHFLYCIWKFSVHTGIKTKRDDFLKDWCTQVVWHAFFFSSTWICYTLL